MFSKSCEYGIRAVIYIASQSMEGNLSKTGDIVKKSGSPRAFTGKILGQLKSAGLVESRTGPEGGFFMSQESIRLMSVSKIVTAIDGDQLFRGCGLGLESCDSNNPCPLHCKFAVIRTQLKDMLEKTTIFDLAVSLKTGDALLLRKKFETI
jgi:Rrf2 family transcriptional regulator, iron-sulfur cluster assembly transcription factor